MDKQMYAVKCEKLLTFYINVEAGSQWEAMNKAEFMHRDESDFIGYGRSMSDIRTVHAVEIDDEINHIK